MSKRKVFCDECKSDVTFTIVNKELVGAIKGKKYTYLGKVAQCISW